MGFVVSKVSERDGLVDPASFELLCRWGSDPATDCSEKTIVLRDRDWGQDWGRAGR